MSSFDPFRQSGYVVFAYQPTSQTKYKHVEVQVKGCPVGDNSALPLVGDVDWALGTDRDDALARTSYQPAEGSAWQLHESGEGLPYDVFIRQVVTR